MQSGTLGVYGQWNRLSSLLLPSPCRRGQGRALLAEADLPAVAAYDTLAFGADRRGILQAWFRSWPENALAMWEGQRLGGIPIGPPRRQL